MREELGDVLIQVVFHAQIAAERGDFNFDDVAREINEKLIRRHPHVFGDGKLDTSEQVLVQWEQIKAKEKATTGKVERKTFKELPPRLPALMYAEAVDKQIEKKELPVDDIVDQKHVQRLAAELKPETAGRLLYELTAACRLRGIDPEAALRQETDRIKTDVEKRVQFGR
jgi:XTP/dITP diphosphohydrolase/tetrapyrrole methylase family protein/MazG family protein